MRLLTLAGIKSPFVRHCAEILVADCEPKDEGAEIGALFDFVHDEIRYVHDPLDIEMLHTADALLACRAGDCDDKCILLASLLGSIGYLTCFVASGRQPRTYTHVICAALLRDHWLPLDATEDFGPGWAPPGRRAWMIIRNYRGQ